MLRYVVSFVLLCACVGPNELYEGPEPDQPFGPHESVLFPSLSSLTPETTPLIKQALRLVNMTGQTVNATISPVKGMSSLVIPAFSWTQDIEPLDAKTLVYFGSGGIKADVPTATGKPGPRMVILGEKGITLADLPVETPPSGSFRVSIFNVSNGMPDVWVNDSLTTASRLDLPKGAVTNLATLHPRAAESPPRAIGLYPAVPNTSLFVAGDTAKATWQDGAVRLVACYNDSQVCQVSRLATPPPVTVPLSNLMFQPLDHLALSPKTASNGWSARAMDLKPEYDYPNTKVYHAKFKLTLPTMPRDGYLKNPIITFRLAMGNSEPSCPSNYFGISAPALSGDKRMACVSGEVSISVNGNMYAGSGSMLPNQDKVLRIAYPHGVGLQGGTNTLEIEIRGQGTTEWPVLESGSLEYLATP